MVTDARPWVKAQSAFVEINGTVFNCTIGELLTCPTDASMDVLRMITQKLTVRGFFSPRVEIAEIESGVFKDRNKKGSLR